MQNKGLEKTLEIKNRGMIALTVILLAVVEVLDITIVAVALPDMKGALSASPTQITWTITVYVIAAAICMPLTGFLTKRFGRKRLLIVSAFGFGASSLLCGLAVNLLQMICFRGMQGAFGALLPALAQSTLLETFPGKESNKAMALFGIGVMLGPILGPVLGGIITDSFGWRWIFFVNIPICIFAGILASRFLTESKIESAKTDWLGLTLLAIAVGSFQYVLDKGNELGWLSSITIQVMLLTSVFIFLWFLIRGLGLKNNIITLKIFRDKNYLLACLGMFIYCGVMLGSYSWLPLWLELFMHYPAATAGLVLAPRGLSCLTIMAFTPFLMKYVDGRWLVSIASILYAIGTYLLSGFNLYVSPFDVVLPNIFQGLATGFFFVPLTSMAYQTLPKHYLHEASGLYNFFRSVGSSVGVAVFSTIMSQMTQVSWHDLTKWITPNRPQFLHWLHIQGYHLHSPIAYQQLAEMFNRQVNMIAFNDGNYLFSFLCLLLIPIVWLIDRPKKNNAVTAKL